MLDMFQMNFNDHELLNGLQLSHALTAIYCMRNADKRLARLTVTILALPCAINRSNFDVHGFSAPAAWLKQDILISSFHGSIMAHCQNILKDVKTNRLSSDSVTQAAKHRCETSLTMASL